MQKEKIAIGFDLGTTSVGWSIVKMNKENDLLEIIDMGVRLFNDPISSDSNVSTRREARGRRRRINRQRIRKFDFYKLLKDYKYVSSKDEFDLLVKTPIYDENTNSYYMPLDLKIKGLTNKLSKEELIVVLHNYIKHRGFLNTIDEDSFEAIENSDDKKEKKENKKEQPIYDSNLLPCENQLKWFKQTGKVLGNIGNAEIPNKDYIKEITIILKKQNVDEQFIESFINLFKRHRHYSEGPGSKNSLSIYGRTKLNENNELVWTGGNMWDKLVGKCTYFPNESRNFKYSPTSELFNLLNDFANMKVSIQNNNDISYLTHKQKNKMLSTTDSSKLTLDKMMKTIGLTTKDIIGGVKGIYLEKPKPEVESLKVTRCILNWLNNTLGLNINLLDNLEFIDNIFISTINFQNVDDRVDALTKFFDNCSIASPTKEQIIELASSKIWSSKKSSLSKKAHMMFIKFALSESGDSKVHSKNQQYFFNEEIQFDNTIFKKFKYFPENYFKDEIMPSTVKRTFNQAIKVLNSILSNKKYKNYEISNIVIEMARDLNSEEEREKIDKEMRANANRLTKLKKYYGVTDDRLLKGENKIKFLLWCEQGRKDIYNGKDIDLNELLTNSHKYQVDHIIPISISFVDSLNNKVLTSYDNNQAKKNLTPLQWLSGKQREEYIDRVYKTYDDIAIRMQESNNKQIKKLKEKYKNKMNNFLLYEDDPSNDFAGFISRQLNDTRYISRLFLSSLNKFFSSSEYYLNSKPKINVINGALTTFARNNYFSEKEYEKRYLFKDRNIYNHHAIDASIVCFLGINKKIEKLMKFKYIRYDQKVIDGKRVWVDNETGEVLDNNFELFKEMSESSKSYLSQMREFVSNPINKNKFVRFSRMLETKSNISLSGETLYSIKTIIENGKKTKYKVNKLNLLTEKNNEIDKLKNFFGDNAKDRESLLCYKYDRELYDELYKIFNNPEYNDAKNPFVKYASSDFINDEKNTKSIYSNKIIVFLDNRYVTTQYLRYISGVSNFDDCLIPKQHNNNAFYDGLNWLSIYVYKTIENKLVPFYLVAPNLKYSKLTKKMEIDDNKLSSFIHKNKIIDCNDFFIINRGTMLIKNGLLFYVSGGSFKNNTIEIKALFSDNKIAMKICDFLEQTKNNRIIKSPNALANDGFKLCDVDILGNVYNIRSLLK